MNRVDHDVLLHCYYTDVERRVGHRPGLAQTFDGGRFAEPGFLIWTSVTTRGCHGCRSESLTRQKSCMSVKMYFNLLCHFIMLKETSKDVFYGQS